MPSQANPAYLAEQFGNLQHIVDVFCAQRRYLESYIPAVYSHDNVSALHSRICDSSHIVVPLQFEAIHWSSHAPMAGSEIAHLYPFRQKLLRGCKLAELMDPHDFRKRTVEWPVIQGIRRGGTLVSADGLVRAVSAFSSTACSTYSFCFHVAPWFPP